MAVEFIFLLSPNNSGSTIMGQYLEAQTGGYLPPFGNNEGQMAPAVREEMRRAQWKPDRTFGWARIRREWEALALADGTSPFIECSPPNIIRVDAIRAEFDGIARYLCSIAGPYAFIASTTYNYHRPALDDERLANAVDAWVFRARHILDTVNRYDDIRLVNYEAFCERPAILNEALGLDVRPLGVLAGKGNDRVGEIRDLSARQFAFMEAAEWDRVNALLAPHGALMEGLGYAPVPGDALVAHAREASDLYEAGRARRAEWDLKAPRGQGGKRRRVAAGGVRG